MQKSKLIKYIWLFGQWPRAFPLNGTENIMFWNIVPLGNGLKCEMSKGPESPMPMIKNALFTKIPLETLVKHIYKLRVALGLVFSVSYISFYFFNLLKTPQRLKKDLRGQKFLCNIRLHDHGTGLIIYDRYFGLRI